MSYGKISVRYAKALFQVAEESGKSEKIYSDVKIIIDACESDEFVLFLQNPTLQPAQKIEVFKTVFETSVDALTMKFLEMLTKSKREAFLKRILMSYLTLHRKGKNIKGVKLITATPLDSNITQEFSDKISKYFNSKIEIQESVQPDIIGGFIIRTENQQLDQSIASKLIEIKKDLIQANVKY